MSHAPRQRRRSLLRAPLAAVVLIAAILPFSSAASAATTDINVELPLGHQIRGVITDPDGHPVAEADVSASSEFTSFSTVSASDGSYVFHAVTNGSYRVQASDQMGAFESRYYGTPDSTPEFDQAAIVVVNSTTVSGVDIALGGLPEGLSISGTMIDPEGTAVGDVYVFVRSEANFGQTRSAVDGTWNIDGLQAGDYRVFVEPANGSALYGGTVANGTIAGPEEEPTLVSVVDADVTGVDVRLPLGRVITGQVTMARPATIVVTAEGDFSGEATVGTNGNYRIQGLRPGGYQVSFRDAIPGPVQVETGTFPYGSYGPGGVLVSRSDAATIDLADADATLESVFLARGTDIVGKVTDGKNGLAHAYLFVCDSNGQIGCASTNGEADGTFRVVHVPTGSYTIFVSVPGRVTGFYQPAGFTIDDFGAAAVRVVSGSNDVKGIKIAVPVGGIVSGRITGPSGEPIVGARVNAFPFGIPPNWLQPTTGADGRYVQTGVPTNEYGLSVQAPEGSDYVSGYYQLGEPGNYGTDFEQATKFRIVEAGDRQAPVITFRDPPAGATDVSIHADVSVRFSEPVEHATSATIVVRDARGRVVPATVSFVPLERTAHITPVESLQPGTKYRVTATSAIADWSGNPFAGASWTFTTLP